MKELEKLKLMLQYPQRYVNQYFKIIKNKTESEYNLRKQFEKYKTGKDTTTKELNQVTEKISLFEAECFQSFHNNKYTNDVTAELTDRIKLFETKLAFLTSQPFINEFTEHGRKLLTYLIRKELFKIENILFNNKLMVFIERNQFDSSIISKIQVGKLIIITSDYFNKQINKLFNSLQADFYEQKFIYESFNFDDLKRLVKTSSKIDDILIDFRYLTVIYITFSTQVIDAKINELNKNVDQFRMLSHSPEIYMKNYFNDFKREISTKFNELKLDKLEILTPILKDMNESEHKLVKHLDVSEVTFKNIEIVQFLIDILNTEKTTLSELLIQETKELLSRVILDKQFQIKDSIINLIGPNSITGKLIRKKNDSVLNDIYNQITTKLALEEETKKKNEIKDTESIFDQNSMLISNQLMVQLMKLCNFPINQKWRLLYRATNDGFLADDFHAKCDGFKNTLTIIKSKNSNIFGGYTEAEWSGHLVYKEDPNAFIFSLVNTDAEPLIMKCSKPQFAIYCSNTFGPVFGLSPCDIAIEHNSNVKKSYSNLGCSYHHPKYCDGSYEALTFLAGSRHFQAVDIEVYYKAVITYLPLAQGK